MRRQTATGGINPVGSSRVLRLDPHSLPVKFEVCDTRADGGIRNIELHRERIVLRRAVRGMRMAINLSVRDFRGIARRDIADGQMLALVHRDPSLTIPLCVAAHDCDVAEAWTAWSELFSLPQLADEVREPAQRRRRRNAIRARRPKFLVRRRPGDPAKSKSVYRGEHEIIARD